MLAVFLLLVPTIGLCLLTAARLWAGLRDGQPRWRLTAAWAAAVAAAVGVTGLAWRVVRDLAALGRSATFPGGESPSLTLVALGAVALAASATAVVAMLAAMRRGPRRQVELPPAAVEIGWVLVLLPLLTGLGMVAMVLLPLVLLSFSWRRAKQKREIRLIAMLARVAASRQPMAPAVRTVAAGRSSGGPLLLVLPHKLAAKLLEWITAGPQKRLSELADSLDAGLPLSDALLASRLVTTRTVATVRAAEQSGRLPQTLAHLAAELQDRWQAIDFRAAGMRLHYLWITAGMLLFYLFNVAESYLSELVFIAGIGERGVPESLEWVLDYAPGSGGELLLPTLVAAATLTLLMRINPPSTWRPRLLRLLPSRVSGAAVLRALAEPLLAGRPVEPVVESLQLAAVDDYWQDRWGQLLGRLSEGERLPEALRSERLIGPAERDAIDSAIGLALVRRGMPDAARADATPDADQPVDAVQPVGVVLRSLANARDRRSQQRLQAVSRTLDFLLVTLIAAFIAVGGWIVFTLLAELITALA